MAVLIRTSHWLGVLELLLKVLHVLIALHALEISHDEFGLGIRRPGHSSIDGHESSETEGPQLSDLGHLRQVVDGNLIVTLLDRVQVCLVLLHEPSESIPKIGLILIEIVHNGLHETLVPMVELRQMAEIDVHRHLFLLPHSLSCFLVILDWLTILLVREPICILVIVGVLWVEFEANKSSLIKKGLTSPKSGRNCSQFAFLAS